MLYQDKIADILAMNLVNAVNDISQRLYPQFEKEYKEQGEGCENAEQYTEKLDVFYARINSYIDKLTSVRPFDINAYLRTPIRESLSSLGSEGGSDYGHDSVRQVFKWFSTQEKIEYKYFAEAPTLQSLAIKIVAEVGNGEARGSAIFNFNYMQDKLIKAVLISAYIKLLVAIKSDSHYRMNLVEKEETKVSDEVRQKLSWMGDKDILKEIFWQISQSLLEKSQKNVIEASKSDITKLIKNNFDFSEKPKSVAAVKLDSKLVYNGDQSALIRLLYYLSFIKLNGNPAPLNASQQQILEFVSDNFRWYNKEDKTLSDIKKKTLEDLWGRTHNTYSTDCSKLLNDENNPQKKKISLLNIVKHLLISKEN